MGKLRCYSCGHEVRPGDEVEFAGEDGNSVDPEDLRIVVDDLEAVHAQRALCDAAQALAMASPSPDTCPECGRWIRDFDPRGCESAYGQRYCLAHFVSGGPDDDVLERTAEEAKRRLHEVDMDEVVTELRRRGVHCYVEQTGGGCATIYAGSQRPDDEEILRWAACAGPGWFEGPGWTNAKGDSRDFYVGPDDDGQADAERAPAGATAAQVADMVAAAIARLGA